MSWLSVVSKSLYFSVISFCFLSLYTASIFVFASSLVSPETSIPSIFIPFIMLLLFMFSIAKIIEKIIIAIAIITLMIISVVFSMFIFFVVFLKLLVLLFVDFCSGSWVVPFVFCSFFVRILGVLCLGLRLIFVFLLFFVSSISSSSISGVYIAFASSSSQLNFFSFIICFLLIFIT